MTATNLLFPGKEPLVSTNIKGEIIDYLFAALFLTQLLVFLGGNALAHDAIAFEQSAYITLSCLQVAAVLYMFTRLCKSMAWGLVITYGLMFLMAYSPFQWRENIALMVGYIGLFYTAYYLRVSRQNFSAILMMALIASATCLTITYAYTSFDMTSRLYMGDVKQDTLFHASMAAMIKNYGVISTGLNGVVQTPYHALSHALMGSLSLLSHQSVIEVYGVASYVFFAPVLILTITAVCVTLDSRRELSIPLCWGLIAAVLWLAPRILEKWLVWDSFFVSESYMVSLGVLMMALPCLFKEKINKTNIIFVFLVTLLITHAKATVGIIYVGLWLSRVLFFRKKSKWPAVADILCLVVAFFATALMAYASARAHSDDIALVPFDFIREYGGGYAITNLIQRMAGKAAINLHIILIAIWQLASFFLFHFLFSWVAIGVAIYRHGWKNLLQAPSVVYVLAATFAGVLAVSLLRIGGGSLFYISNVAMFIALPIAISLMASVGYQKKIPLLPILGFIFIVELVGSMSLLKNDLARVAHDRQAVRGGLIQELIALRTAPLNQVYRYAGNTISNIPMLPCIGYPFIFPAISEHAWTGVIRPNKDCLFFEYSFEQYGLTRDHQEVEVQPRLLNGMKIVNFSDH